MRWIALLSALFVVGGGVTAVATRASSPVATLTVGKSAFWNGAYVASAVADVPGAAACAVEQCYEYPLVVGGSGSRLRVAIDSPDRTDVDELDLVDPSGAQVA